MLDKGKKGKRPRRFRMIFSVVGLAALLAWLFFLRDDREFQVPHLEIGHLETHPLTIENRWGDNIRAQSFSLVVPENREAKNLRHIQIAFERIPSTAVDPLPPIFVLAGGPGSSGTQLARGDYLYLFEELAAFCDVVLIDQRGTGQSIPNLQCSGGLDLPTDLEQPNETAIVQALSQRVQRCMDDFRANGVDLAAYNSRENADDIDAIRGALGYGKIMLMGYSYGTELSMVYMRRHPGAVHGAIMTGPTAPDMALKSPKAVQTQFEGMDRLLDRDPRLRKLIPNLSHLMKETHRGLASAPAHIEVPLMDAVDDDEALPLRGIFSAISLIKPNWEMTMGDMHLQLMVQDMIGRDVWIPRLPAFYYRISQGDYRQVGNILRNFRRRPMPNGLMFATNCRTGYAPARFQQGLIEEKATALSQLGISFGRQPQVCEPCGLPPLGKDFLDPIRSDSPVLLITGTLDGRTPMANLAELQARFPNNQTIVVENAGHNRLLDNQIRDGILAYLKGEPLPVSHIVREVVFEAPVPFRHSIEDELRRVLDTSAGQGLAEAYETIFRRCAQSEEFLYDLSESTINRLGYALLDEGRPADAVAVFLLNQELHPDSSNTYDSLGDGFMAQGKYQKARRYYRESINRDFLNGHARGMLRRIDEMATGSKPE